MHPSFNIIYIESRRFSIIDSDRIGAECARSLLFVCVCVCIVAEILSHIIIIYSARHAYINKRQRRRQHYVLYLYKPFDLPQIIQLNPFIMFACVVETPVGRETETILAFSLKRKLIKLYSADLTHSSQLKQFPRDFSSQTHTHLYTSYDVCISIDSRNIHTLTITVA